MNTFMKLKIHHLLIGLLFLLQACEKAPVAPPKIDSSTLRGFGLVVLNEGLFNMNNSTITWHDFETKSAHTDWFESVNGRRLGDTGNDLVVHGGKIYVIVTVSSQLEILDANTGQSLRQIPFFDGTRPRQPRAVAFLHNKAFVCSFDGTVAVIDTATLEIERFIQVGRNPDGIATANNKIYVSNSGGLDFPNYDNTVSVIDFDTMTEIKRIPVGINPFTIRSDGGRYLYLVSRGNYADIPMRLQIIDTAIDEVVHTFTGFQALDFALGKNIAYVYYHDFMGRTGSSIMTINMDTWEIITPNFISDGTRLETIYGIYADTLAGRIFVADAKGFTTQGRIYSFNKDGELLYSFNAGLNPSSMGIVYKYSAP